jgi:3-hydroxyisobutyrate dehydrogenase-like beta-hydroxyacid dehydrogenase
MQTPSRVSVIGQGKMGRAYVERFRRSGIEVRGLEPDALSRTCVGETEIIVLALRTGSDAISVLADVNARGKTIVCNLTTQSIPETRECIALAGSRNISYFGGGVTGGASEAAAGHAAILIGPPPAAIAQIISHVGNLVVYPDSVAATAAKLLHNLVLIVQNHVIAAALQVAGPCGVDNLASVLDLGTAGRKPSASSAVRDHSMTPRSSYTCRLAAKDLRALSASFAELQTLRGIDLRELAAFYETGGDTSYTGKALQSLAEEEW